MGLRLPPRGGGFGVRTLSGLSCAAGVCSNRGGVVSIVAVLRRCLFSKAESRVAWLSYGVIAVIRRGREHRGGFTAFSVRNGEVVISMAVLYFRFNYGKVVIIVRGIGILISE